MNNINSKRQYHIICFDDLQQKFSSKFTLNQLLGVDEWKHDGTELQYTLQEDIDDILDMRFSEEMIVSVDRNNQDQKGILKRIN